MKKFLSVVLVLAVALGMLVVPVSAGTIAELDNTGETAVLFTFEDDGLKTRFSGSLSTWQKDANHALSYYNGSWSSGSISDNPIKEKGSDANSVVNSSAKAWNYHKGSIDTWSTAGGNALHVYTENGPEPVILQNGVTYKLSFDYMVSSGHLSGDFVYNGEVRTFSDDNESWASVGYGYKLTTSSGLHPFATPQTTLEKFISYKKGTDNGGTYVGNGSATKQIGNWYHVEYEFTPSGLVDLDFSQEGTLECPAKAPFLIFYMAEYSGASIYIDNIKLQGQIAGTLNAMGGTLTDTAYSGFVGSEAAINPPTRYGNDFAGWYKDGALTNKFDGIYTSDMNNGFLFASWDNTKIGFESYTPASSDTQGSKFSVVNTRAASGKKSMMYKNTRSIIEFNPSSRTGAANMFSVKAIEPLTEGTKQKYYKVTFKYYVETASSDILIYPVTVGTKTSDSTYVAYTDNSITLTSSDVGSWKTAVIYFTPNMAAGGNNFGIHAHATSNNNATVYFDDVSVVASIGGANLTVNAGEGTIDGQQSVTYAADYGDDIIPGTLYYKDHFVEGIYLDADFTEVCTENAFVETLANKTLYVKWSKTQNFEYIENEVSSGMNFTTDFAKSGAVSLGLDIALGENAGDVNYAAIGECETATTYVLEFYYYAVENTSSEIKPVLLGGTDSVVTMDGFTVEGTTAEWKKAAVYFTSNANSTELGLAVVPQRATSVKIYIDDVTVTALASNQVCVLFNTMSVDKQIVASIGTKGTTLVKPVSPEAVGKTFGGWCTDATLSTVYSGTSYNSNRTLYAKMNDATVSNLKGDVDGNGSIDAADLARLKRYLAGHDVEVLNNADVDSNRRINAIDLVKLYKLIIK